MRFCLVNACLLRHDLPLETLNRGLLGRNLVPRRIHREPVVAIIDARNDVTGMDKGIVFNIDRSEIARDLRCQRGVMRADIGIIGGNDELADR